MNKLRILLYMCIAVFTLNSCTDEVEPQDTPYITFETSSMDITFDQGGSITQEVKVYAANTSDQERTVGIAVVGASTDVDAAAYVVPTTVTFAAGSNVATLSINLTDVNMSPFASQTLVVSLTNAPEIYTGEDLTINVGLRCPNNGVKVKMVLGFDSWPEEVYWRLVDVNAGVIVLASQATPGYGAYAGMTGGVTIQECVPSGDYQLQIYDGYGDGGTSYVVTADGVQVASVSASSYGGSTSVDFSI